MATALLRQPHQVHQVRLAGRQELMVGLRHRTHQVPAKAAITTDRHTHTVASFSKRLAKLSMHSFYHRPCRCGTLAQRIAQAAWASGPAVWWVLHLPACTSQIPCIHITATWQGHRLHAVQGHTLARMIYIPGRGSSIHGWSHPRAFGRLLSWLES